MSQTVRLQFDNKINPFLETSRLSLTGDASNVTTSKKSPFYAWFPCIAVLSGGNPDRNGLPLLTETLREHHHTGSLHQKI
ncbi:hypothetical protein [Nostoc sp.]|uniref:hypothetical protein n=1 Tax=Nostoc sp. TaxID=1180 RepID=UPI002FFAB575